MNLTSNNLDLLAGISHEIRNPLNAIIGIAHLLQQEHSKEDQEELVRNLLQSSENLMELTNNILDFSKMEAGAAECTLTTVNLQESIPISLYGQKAIADAKGLDLNFSIDPELPPLVQIDKVKFNQILLNLVSNAIKFTSEGSISVLVDVLNCTATEVTFKVAVIDTGIGVPAEKLKTILEPFRQGGNDIHLKYGGTGLGLSISERLVSAMGGKLTIKSELNKGSEFSFVLTLNLPEDKTENVPMQVEISPEHLREGLKVLIVDDNEINLLVARKNLENWKVSYELAKDGEEAVQKILQQKFDLVLMDLHMPNMDGFEAITKIRALENGRYSDLPVIALSGSTGSSQQDEIVATGFNDFLNKPFRPKDLLAKILAVQEKMKLLPGLLDYRPELLDGYKKKKKTNICH